MRATSATMLRSQLRTQCACGEPATRFRIGHWKNEVALPFPLAPNAVVNVAVDGSYTTTEHACDAHSEQPHTGADLPAAAYWREHAFAEAVRELNTEAGR